MFYAQIRFPVFFERVNANFTIRCHIWMEDFREEKCFWRRLREILAQNQFHSKESTSIWCTSWMKPSEQIIKKTHSYLTFMLFFNTYLVLLAQLEYPWHLIRWFVLLFLRVHLCGYRAFLLPLAEWFAAIDFPRLMTKIHKHCGK